jgi:hypothetical protein
VKQVHTPEAVEVVVVEVEYIRNMLSYIQHLPKQIRRIHHSIVVVWYNHYIDIPLVIPAHMMVAAEEEV